MQGKYSKWFCQVCDRDIPGDTEGISADQHLQSKKHLRNQSRLEVPLWHCVKCAVWMSPEQSKQHERTPAHHSNVKSRARYQPPAPKKKVWECKICERSIDINSKKQHLQGKRHKAKDIMLRLSSRPKSIQAIVLGKSKSIRGSLAATQSQKQKPKSNMGREMPIVKRGLTGRSNFREPLEQINPSALLDYINSIWASSSLQGRVVFDDHGRMSAVTTLCGRKTLHIKFGFTAGHSASYAWTANPPTERSRELYRKKNPRVEFSNQFHHDFMISTAHLGSYPTITDHRQHPIRPRNRRKLKTKAFRSPIIPLQRCKCPRCRLRLKRLLLAKYREIVIFGQYQKPSKRVGRRPRDKPFGWRGDRRCDVSWDAEEVTLNGITQEDLTWQERYRCKPGYKQTKMVNPLGYKDISLASKQDNKSNVSTLGPRRDPKANPKKDRQTVKTIQIKQKTDSQKGTKISQGKGAPGKFLTFYNRNMLELAKISKGSTGL